MRRLPLPVLISVLLLHGGCGASPEQALPAEADPARAVWAVDLVRTLPGQQDAYLRNIETNWAGARSLAREGGSVLSYRALVASPDSARGWDVILMTEYADSTAWADRETTFQMIFASPEFAELATPRPSSELRVFEASDVAMRALVAGPQP